MAIWFASIQFQFYLVLIERIGFEAIIVSHLGVRTHRLR
jgi:hypothetical protein